MLANEDLYLELALGCYSSTCLLNLTRFFSSRGKAKLLLSDDSKQFISPQTHKFRGTKGIIWRFNLNSHPLSFMNEELKEKVLNPQPFLYGHKIILELCNKPYNDTVSNDDYTNISQANQLFPTTLNHFW